MKIFIVLINVQYLEQNYLTFPNEIFVLLILDSLNLSIEFDFINSEDMFRNYNYRLPSHIQTSDFIFY
jgi:hypothetical protein